MLKRILILIGITIVAAANDATLRGFFNSHHSNPLVDKGTIFSIENVKTNKPLGRRSPGGRGDKGGKKDSRRKKGRNGKKGKKGKKHSDSGDGNHPSSPPSSPCPDEKLFRSQLYLNVTGNPDAVFNETEILEQSVDIAYERSVDSLCRSIENVKLVGIGRENGTFIDLPDTTSRYLQGNIVDDDDNFLPLNLNFSLFFEITMQCFGCPDDDKLLNDASRRRWRGRSLIGEDTCTCNGEASDDSDDDSGSNAAPSINEFVEEFNRVIEMQEIISVREAFDAKDETTLIGPTSSPTVSPTPDNCPVEPPFSNSECDSDSLPASCSYETSNCIESNQAVFATCTCVDGEFSCVSGANPCEECPEEIPEFGSECNSDALPQQCSYEPFSCPGEEPVYLTSCACGEDEFVCTSFIVTCPEECPEERPEIGSECLVTPERCQYEPFSCPGSDEVIYLTSCVCGEAAGFQCNSAFVQCPEECPEERPEIGSECSLLVSESCQYEPFSCPGSDEVIYLTSCACDEAAGFQCNSAFVQCPSTIVEKTFTVVGDYTAENVQLPIEPSTLAPTAPTEKQI